MVPERATKASLLLPAAAAAALLTLPVCLPSVPALTPGYDIEDAIVMNRASLDRGFGRCIVLKKSQAVLRKYPNRAQDRVVAPAPGGRMCSTHTHTHGCAVVLPLM
jgi:RNA polymerase Rpb2, domain 6